MAAKRTQKIAIFALLLVVFAAAAGGFLALSDGFPAGLARFVSIQTGSESLHAWVFGSGRGSALAESGEVEAGSGQAPMALVDLFG